MINFPSRPLRLNFLCRRMFVQVFTRLSSPPFFDPFYSNLRSRDEMASERCIRFELYSCVVIESKTLDTKVLSHKIFIPELCVDEYKRGKFRFVRTCHEFFLALRKNLGNLGMMEMIKFRLSDDS